MQAPHLPSYKPSKQGKHLNEIGAEHAYWSGRKDQAEILLALFGVL